MNPLDTPNVPFYAGTGEYKGVIPRGVVIRARAGLHAAIDWLSDRGMYFEAKPYREDSFLLEYDLPLGRDDRELVVEVMKASDGQL